ncbi:MAG: hypothetical protein ACO33A_01920 [Hyphomonas sp.]
MVGFFAIFAAVLVLGLVMLSGILSGYGYSLADPEMRVMLGLCLVVAAYVAWRIQGVLRARAGAAPEDQASGGAGRAKLSDMFGRRSRALSARQAELEARRRRLIAEGKLEAGPAPVPRPEPAVPPPGRASADSVRDRMAARRERVRKAREEGRLD